MSSVVRVFSYVTRSVCSIFCSIGMCFSQISLPGTRRGTQGSIYTRLSTSGIAFGSLFSVQKNACLHFGSGTVMLIRTSDFFRFRLLPCICVRAAERTEHALPAKSTTSGGSSSRAVQVYYATRAEASPDEWSLDNLPRGGSGLRRILHRWAQHGMPSEEPRQARLQNRSPRSL